MEALALLYSAIPFVRFAVSFMHVAHNESRAVFLVYSLFRLLCCLLSVGHSYPKNGWHRKYVIQYRPISLIDTNNHIFVIWSWKGFNLEFGQVKQTYVFYCTPTSQRGMGISIVTASGRELRQHHIKIIQCSAITSISLFFLICYRLLKHYRNSLFG